ncbi:hypothetical protein CesoFtcFv8_013144 [Champsocephalus esox]|uniref:Uncharacterized protein n=1 Tax=Champsocephalus esox TaxID=159716 RepID=A0AAN8GW80_9TELE|nr:hypothetical protein CesoFtcFv8_013144 [Champsocephalus esox]
MIWGQKNYERFNVRKLGFPIKHCFVTKSNFFATLRLAREDMVDMLICTDVLPHIHKRVTESLVRPRLVHAYAACLLVLPHYTSAPFDYDGS